jgi:hypothetical protein
MCISVINIFDTLEEEPIENTEYFVETLFRKPFYAIYKVDYSFPYWKMDNGDRVMVTEGQKFREKNSQAFAEIKVRPI